MKRDGEKSASNFDFMYLAVIEVNYHINNINRPSENIFNVINIVKMTHAHKH